MLVFMYLPMLINYFFVVRGREEVQANFSGIWIKKKTLKVTDKPLSNNVFLAQAVQYDTQETMRVLYCLTTDTAKTLSRPSCLSGFRQVRIDWTISDQSLLKSERYSTAILLNQFTWSVLSYQAYTSMDCVTMRPWCQINVGFYAESSYPGSGVRHVLNQSRRPWNYFMEDRW